MSDRIGTERIAFVIIESEITETIKGVPDSAEYVPCIVIEGKSGYHTTNWFWGKDPVIANKLVAEYNHNLGLTPEDVHELIDQSIKLQMQEDSPYHGSMAKMAALAKEHGLDGVKFAQFWQMRFPDHGTSYMEDWARRLHDGTAKEQADHETMRALHKCGLLE
jgi:hypothetical protein